MQDDDVPFADRGHPPLQLDPWARGRAWLLLLSIQWLARVLALGVRRYGRGVAPVLCRALVWPARIAAVGGLILCVIAVVQHEWSVAAEAAGVVLLGAFVLSAVRHALPFVADAGDHP